MPPARWRTWITREDFVWVLLFVVIEWISVADDPLEAPLLTALALLQIVEPRLRFLQTQAGRVLSVGSKIALCYLLIGFTGGPNSSYFLILLVPIITGSTAFGPFGATLVTLATAASYLSFLAGLDWNKYVIETQGLREFGLRLVVLCLAGYLANRQAAATREQAKRHQAVAEQLAAANRHLQEAEAAVRRSERLAALGQLSAGLAHELRNPLGTMKASAEMLAKQLNGEKAVAAELAEFISTEVDRTNLLVTRFLEFARPLRLRLAPADPADVIDRAVGQIERAGLRRDVAIFKNYSPEIGPFSMDADLIERVAYNLLLNAVQATGPGGAVTVKTLPSGDMAEISVIDRGSGIEPKHRENIFNPFFTTKPDGVGLGLAIVAKIVDEHGGRTDVDSELGKGSVFRVYLPMSRAATEDQPAFPTPPEKREA